MKAGHGYAGAIDSAFACLFSRLAGCYRALCGKDVAAY